MHIKNFLLPILVFGMACKSGPSDQELSSSVNSTLSSSTGRINATVDKGVATLTGECPDDACKTTAEASVRSVKGVTQVVNNITVAPAPPPVVTISPDDSLKTAVQAALSEYNTVQASVANGVVTLTGEARRTELQCKF